jgi:hypothetical protein
MRKNTTAMAAIRTTAPPTPPPMSAVFDGLDESSSLLVEASLDEVKTAAVVVAVESADVPCWDSMFAGSVEEVV